ncbi:MAG TPA: hypothetical protein DCY26_11170, partial [Hyphomonas sp.]|nr:hypothetical protein [Hyphomonas sp.]
SLTTDEFPPAGFVSLFPHFGVGVKDAKTKEGASIPLTFVVTLEARFNVPDLTTVVRLNGSLGTTIQTVFDKAVKSVTRTFTCQKIATDTALFAEALKQGVAAECLATPDFPYYLNNLYLDHCILPAVIDDIVHDTGVGTSRLPLLEEHNTIVRLQRDLETTARLLQAEADHREKEARASLEQTETLAALDRSNVIASKQRILSAQAEGQTLLIEEGFNGFKDGTSIRRVGTKIQIEAIEAQFERNEERERIKLMQERQAAYVRMLTTLGEGGRDEAEMAALSLALETGNLNAIHARLAQKSSDEITSLTLQLQHELAKDESGQRAARAEAINEILQKRDLFGIAELFVRSRNPGPGHG